MTLGQKLFAAEISANYLYNYGNYSQTNFGFPRGGIFQNSSTLDISSFWYGRTDFKGSACSSWQKNFFIFYKKIFDVTIVTATAAGRSEIRLDFRNFVLAPMGAGMVKMKKGGQNCGQGLKIFRLTPHLPRSDDPFKPNPDPFGQKME